MLRRRAVRTLAYSLAAGAVLLAATGCEGMQKRDWGTAIGGVVGGLAGYKIGGSSAGGAAVGALLGAVAGRMIGQYMDDADRRKLAETIDETPRGQTVRWHNDETGRDFAVTPTSDSYARGDKECRTFDQVVYVDGRREVMEGLACRTPGGEEFEFSDQAA